MEKNKLKMNNNLKNNEIIKISKEYNLLNTIIKEKLQNSDYLLISNLKIKLLRLCSVVTLEVHFENIFEIFKTVFCRFYTEITNLRGVVTSYYLSEFYYLLGTFLSGDELFSFGDLDAAFNNLKIGAEMEINGRKECLSSLSQIVKSTFFSLIVYYFKYNFYYYFITILLLFKNWL